MIDFEMELLQSQPNCLSVLRAYFEALQDRLNSPDDATTATCDDSADDADQTEIAESDANPVRRRRSTWLPRLVSLDGVDRDELSQIHGRLIAYDLLKCDLADRSSGVVYQLTATGRAAMHRLGDAVVEAAA